MPFYKGYTQGVYGFLISGNDFEEVMQRAEKKARDHFPDTAGWDKPVVGLYETNNT